MPTETWNEAVVRLLALIAAGEGGGSLDATATASAPSYVEGSDNPLSLNLAGALRVISESVATINVGFDVNGLFNGSTTLTPKFAVISCSSSGDNEIVAAVTSKKIRVLQYLITASAAVNAKWQSSTAGDKTGLLYMASAGQGAAPGFSPVGQFETASGEALQLNLSGAVAVGGWVVYCEV